VSILSLLTESSQVGYSWGTGISTSTEAVRLLSSSRSPLDKEHTVGELETVETSDCHLGDGVIYVFAESEPLRNHECVNKDLVRETLVPNKPWMVLFDQHLL
jgi:hypothetical protein